MRNFKVGIAPDSFKGSMTALQAATRIERGLNKAISNLSVRKIPMADGGEGTAFTIVEATGGSMVKRTVRDPLGRKIKASFGLSGDGKTAVIEMAEANGLVLLKQRERNPMKTSTYGTGELIRHALGMKAKKILIGIGGSATNDGGTGMARALGVRFLDKKGRSLKDSGGALKDLDRIDVSGLDQRLKGIKVEVACDVANPFTGSNGASYVYGPQKGATPEMIKQLDANLKLLAKVIKRDIGVDVLKVPGSGAAGGLGGGLMAFLGGELRPGVDIVVDTVKLERRLKGCNLVITGEGRMDGQTVNGKTPVGVAGTAKKLGIPVIAICGQEGKGIKQVLTVGIDAYMSTMAYSITDEQIAKLGPIMLEDCAEQLGRILALQIGLARARK